MVAFMSCEGAKCWFFAISHNYVAPLPPPPPPPYIQDGNTPYFTLAYEAKRLCSLHDINFFLEKR